MEQLIIEAGGKTPHIHFSAADGILKISGRSIPENSVDFYAPVFKWIEEYVQQPNTQTQLVIQLEYFNTSSSKCLLDIFRRFEPLHQSARSVVSVLWHYEEEDEDMQEAGEDYQTIVKLPFTILKMNR